jgi:hypothetical protein
MPASDSFFWHRLCTHGVNDEVGDEVAQAPELECARNRAQPIWLKLDMVSGFTSDTVTKWAEVRYRGLAKNAARLIMLFAMSNLWMVCKMLLQAGARSYTAY